MRKTVLSQNPPIIAKCKAVNCNGRCRCCVTTRWPVDLFPVLAAPPRWPVEGIDETNREYPESFIKIPYSRQVAGRSPWTNTGSRETHGEQGIALHRDGLFIGGVHGSQALLRLFPSAGPRICRGISRPESSANILYTVTSSSDGRRFNTCS